MKRFASLKNAYVFDQNILDELYNDILYYQNLSRELLKENSGKHYTFNDIKDFLTCSEFYRNQLHELSDYLAINKSKEKLIQTQIEQTNE